MENWSKSYRIKFGKNLKDLLNKQGKDVATVASIANIEYKQIYRIINAENEPKITTLLPIAKGLGIHPKEFFDFDFPIEKVKKD